MEEWVMVEPTIELCVALLSVGVVSGFINAVSGGGGLITIPVLLLTGFDPAQALATNKLQLLFGPAAALAKFRRAGLVDCRFAAAIALFVFVGAVLGALVVVMLDRSVLSWLVPTLLVLPVLYIVLCPRSDEALKPRLPAAFLAPSFGSALGFYDGIFGPGVGSLWITSLVALGGQTMRQAAAHSNVFILVGAAAGLLVFAADGHVVVWAGLLMGAGQILGGSLGARMVVLHGARWIRPMLMLTAIGAVAKLLAGESSV